jgi:pyruvate/2-oxoglutarate/acetoin dehydrogenase E1 component
MPADKEHPADTEHPADIRYPSVLEHLNQALHQSMAVDERVYLLGEDLLDPYGGAFKVTRGLSSAHPGRVLATPISEAGIVGVASGMALRGLRPVVELMFGDFITLAADQLINHAAKFRWMYNEQVRVPLVVRLPMGGRRGYGPTHSQTLEKHFLGVPGLRALAPTTLGDPGALLRGAILQNDDPLLFVENKLLYLLPVHTPGDLPDFEVEEMPAHGGDASPGALDSANYAPAFRLRVRGAPSANLTLAAYGYMAELARQAVLRMAYEHEIFAELVVLTQLAPFAVQPVIESAQRSQRLLVIEEGGLSLGWGAEVLARACEALGPELRSARRLAALDLPVPASGALEKAVLPGVDAILQAALQALKAPIATPVEQGVHR